MNCFPSFGKNRLSVSNPWKGFFSSPRCSAGSCFGAGLRCVCRATPWWWPCPSCSLRARFWAAHARFWDCFLQTGRAGRVSGVRSCKTTARGRIGPKLAVSGANLTENFQEHHFGTHYPFRFFSAGYPLRVFRFGFRVAGYRARVIRFGFSVSGYRRRISRFGLRVPGYRGEEFRFGFCVAGYPAPVFRFGFSVAGLRERNFRFGFRVPGCPGRVFRFGFLVSGCLPRCFGAARRTSCLAARSRR